LHLAAVAPPQIVGTVKNRVVAPLRGDTQHDEVLGTATKTDVLALRGLDLNEFAASRPSVVSFFGSTKKFEVISALGQYLAQASYVVTIRSKTPVRKRSFQLANDCAKTFDQIGHAIG
jgi:hypothetical protein